MITQQDVSQVIPSSSKYYKLIVIDLIKQQKLDADPKAIQETNFTEDLGRAGNNVFLY